MTDSRTLCLHIRVGELKALGEVGQAVSSTLDLETVLSTIVSRAIALAGMDADATYEYDEARGEFHLHTADRLQDEVVTALRAGPIRKDEGALGRTAMAGEPVQIRDIAEEGSYQSLQRAQIYPRGRKYRRAAGVTNGAAEISVTDTGVGIAPEDQATVFEEFRQVGTASKKVEGTALGLAIFCEFVELHGGRIWIKSTVGSGSTFAFTLPLHLTSE